MSRTRALWCPQSGSSASSLSAACPDVSSVGVPTPYAFHVGDPTRALDRPYAERIGLAWLLATGLCLYVTFTVFIYRISDPCLGPDAVTCERRAALWLYTGVAALSWVWSPPPWPFGAAPARGLGVRSSARLASRPSRLDTTHVLEA